MQLPIDVKALIDEATNIKEAQNTPLSVSVYIDEKAPADLAARVRNVFASQLPSVRMTVSYLDSSFTPHPGDDLAIIAAGTSLSIGAAAAAIRAVGVPVMVATTQPTDVARIAEEGGHAVPEGDLAYPEMPEDAREPFALDDESAEALDERMGRWIVTVCHEKRLALAIAFPFMRRSLAKDAVQTTSLQNAGIGIVPLLSGADLPVMTLNQAKMVLQIAAAYGHEMNKDRMKELAAVVGSAFVFRTLARELVEFIPILGFIVKPSVAYGGTSALGYATIEYFEGGENATGIAAVAEKAAETGTKLVSKVREIAADPSSVDIAGKVNEVVPLVRDTAQKYAPIVRDSVSKCAPIVKDAVSNVAKSVSSSVSAGTTGR